MKLFNYNDFYRLIIIELFIFSIDVYGYNIETKNATFYKYVNALYFSYKSYILNDGKIITSDPTFPYSKSKKKNGDGSLFIIDPVTNNVSKLDFPVFKVKDTEDSNIGFTFEVDEINNKIFVCGPRTNEIDFAYDDYGIQRKVIYMSGKCYDVDYLQKTSKEISYTCNHKINVHCTIGFATTINDKEIYGTALGNHNFSGEIFNVISGWNYFSLSDNDEPVYFGYSLSNGYVLDNDAPSIIVGKPNGNYFKGEVYVLGIREEILIISEKEASIGSKFGYSVTSLKIKEEDLHLIIVGAPYNSKYLNDEGAIFCYKNQNDAFVKVAQMFGTKRKQMLGYYVSSLIDLDDNGSNELAIGIPGDEGRGTLRICYIKPDEFSLYYCSDINPVEEGTTMFGWHVHSKILKDNQKKLVIGSKGKSFLFSVKPVKNIEITVLFDEEVHVPTEKKCLHSDVQYNCMRVTINAQLEDSFNKVDITSIYKIKIKISVDENNEYTIKQAFILYQGKLETVIEYEFSSPDHLSAEFDIAIMELAIDRDNFILNVEVFEFDKTVAITPWSNIHLNYVVKLVETCEDMNKCGLNLLLTKSENVEENFIIDIGKEQQDSLDMSFEIKAVNRPAIDVHVFIVFHKFFNVNVLSGKSINYKQHPTKQNFMIADVDFIKYISTNSKVPFKIHVLCTDNRNKPVDLPPINLTVYTPKIESNLLDNTFLLDVTVINKFKLDIKSDLQPDLISLETTNHSSTAKFLIKSNGRGTAFDVKLNIIFPMTSGDEDIIKYKMTSQDVDIKQCESKLHPNIQQINVTENNLTFPDNSLSAFDSPFMLVQCKTPFISSGSTQLISIEFEINKEPFIRNNNELLKKKNLIHIVSWLEFYTSQNVIKAKDQIDFSQVILTISQIKQAPVKVASWIIPVTVILCLLLIFVIVFVLYKKGFFKKKSYYAQNKGLENNGLSEKNNHFEEEGTLKTGTLDKIVTE